MYAEIIAVGSELTTGAKLDTNSQWLSQQLAELGIPTQFHSTVADDLPALVDVIRTATKRSDVILITGGLGPTLDDLTREALAELCQKPLVLHEPSLEYIENLFRRRNRIMSERNRIQAMFPEGSTPIPNPRGTAPGIWMTVDRPAGKPPCLIAAMPGVPSEMKRMYDTEVKPKLPGGGTVIRHARVQCFGIGESAAEELLGDLTARGRDPEVGITVHEATITLRISAHGDTEEECHAKISSTHLEARQRLGSLVYGVEDEELEHVIIRELIARGQTVSTAESGTGGLLSYRLTESPGQLNCFAGGIVAPSEAALQAMLLPQDFSGGRAERACAVAAATRRKLTTDFALAILDCPEFHPDNPATESPVCFVALATANGERYEEVSQFGDPAIQKSRTAKAALNCLRLHLLAEIAEPNSDASNRV